MEYNSKWFISEKEKNSFISVLTDNLATLRTHADISQEDLSHLIGISRQTYSSIERRVRRMSWSTYLSLIFFFDHNNKTHEMLRKLSLFPKELISRFNDGEAEPAEEQSPILSNFDKEILDCLDEQAKHSIATVAMIEYARCTKVSGEEVVKSFNGYSFFAPAVVKADIAAAKALKNIKKRNADEK